MKKIRDRHFHDKHGDEPEWNQWSNDTLDEFDKYMKEHDPHLGRETGPSTEQRDLAEHGQSKYSHFLYMEIFRCYGCNHAMEVWTAEPTSFDNAPIRTAYLVHRKFHYDMIAKMDRRHGTFVVYPPADYDPYFGR